MKHNWWGGLDQRRYPNKRLSGGPIFRMMMTSFFPETL